MSNEVILKEPAYLQRLWLKLVRANVVICLPLLIYEVIATHFGIRMGDKIDWPILLVFLINFPSSLVAIAWANLVFQYVKTIDNSNLLSVITISFFLLGCGVGQYYLIGRAVRKLVLRRIRKRVARGEYRRGWEDETVRK